MNERGYTILEALIAFAVLSVVLVALFGAGGGSLHAIDAGARAQRAELLAQSKLDEIAALHGPLPSSSRGLFEGSDVSWELDATDLAPVGHGSLRLQDVRLTIAWPRAERPQTLTLQTRHLGIVPQ